MKTVRLYALTLYLLNYGKSSATELAKHIEVSVRTIQRDIDAYEREIYDLLQKLVISSQNDDIIDDCLQLIGDYACQPLTIMEQGFEHIKENKKPDAKYVIDLP